MASFPQTVTAPPPPPLSHPLSLPTPSPLVTKFHDMFERLTTLEEARDLSVRERDGKDSDEGNHIPEGNNQLSLVYGEFGPEAMINMFNRFSKHSQVTSSFLDIGSGTAKVLIAAAMLGTFTTVVGVETIESLHEAALRNVATYREAAPDDILKCIHGDALVKDTYTMNKAALSCFKHVFCNATMFSETMMSSLSKLPFDPGTLFVTCTNKLDEVRWEQVDEWCEEVNGNWGNKTTLRMFKRREKRETFIRMTAKKMSSAR